MPTSLKRPVIHNFPTLRLNCPSPVRLANGMQMWVIGNGEDEINRFTLIMGGGAMHESKAMTAYITAANVLQGSNRFSPEQVAQLLDYYGAWKASQSHDFCSILSISSLNEHFEKMLDLFKSCVTEPSFPDDELSVLKQRLAGNCATSRQQVATLAGDAMKQLYYGPTHPLSRVTTPEGILSIDRNDIMQFYTQHYNASNARIILAGKIGDKELATVERVFGSWTANGPVDNDDEPPIVPQDKMLQIVDKPGAVQSAINITLRAIPRRHPDYNKLRILIMALGGYFGSRLNQNIREEKGYTYGIRGFLAGRKADAYIGINTECATQYTWHIIDEVKLEMLKLQNKPIPKVELDVVRQHIISDLAKTFDTPFTMAEYVNGTLLNGTYPEYFNDQIDTLQTVTATELQELAKRYLLPEKMRIVIAGDAQAIHHLKP